MSSGEWAAWVQAVGSVAAIFVAIIIAHRDALHRKRDRLKDRQEYFDAIKGLMDEAQRYIQVAHEDLDAGDHRKFFAYYWSKKEADDLAVALMQATLDKIPSAGAFLQALFMRRLLLECQNLVVQAQRELRQHGQINSDTLLRLSNVADAAQGAVLAFGRARSEALKVR